MNDLEITPRKYQDETDLQKFIRIFEPSKFKTLQNGIEVRGVGDMHRATNKAAELIKHHSLALVVINSGEMAAYKAFEVREIDMEALVVESKRILDELNPPVDIPGVTLKDLWDSGIYAKVPSPADGYAAALAGPEAFEIFMNTDPDPFGVKGGQSDA